MCALHHHLRMLYRCPRRVCGLPATHTAWLCPHALGSVESGVLFPVLCFLNDRTVHVHHESPPTHYPCFMLSLPLVWLRAVLALRPVQSSSLRIQGQLRFAVSLCAMRATQESPLFVSILRHWEAPASAQSKDPCSVPKYVLPTSVTQSHRN